MLTEKQKRYLDLQKSKGVPAEQAIAGLGMFDMGLVDTPELSESQNVISKIKENEAKGGDSQSFLSDIGQDFLEMGSDVKESITSAVQSGADTLTQSREGEILPERAGLRIAGDTAGAITGTIGSFIKGLAKMATSQQKEENFAQFVQDAVDKDIPVPGVGSLSDIAGGAQFVAENLPVSEDVKEDIGAAAKVAALPFEVAGAGIAARQVGQVGRVLAKETPQAIQATTDAVVNTAKNIKLPKVEMPEFTSPIKLDSRLTTNLTPDQIDAGINEAQLVTLKGSKDDVLAPMVDEALRTWSDPSADPYKLGIDFVDTGVEGMRAKLSNVGGEIGKIRETFNTTPVQASNIDLIESSFVSKLENNLGYTAQIVDDAVEFAPIAGRNVRLTAADKRSLEQAYQDLQMAKNGTKQTVLDNRINIDTEIDFGKDPADLPSRQVQTVLKDVRANYKKELEQGLTPEQVLKNEEYAEMLRFFDEYDKATSKGNNIEYFLDRVYGTRKGRSVAVMDKIQQETGVNLQAVALALRYANEIADPTKQSRLKQTFEKAGLDIAQEVAPGGSVLRLLTDSFEKVKDVYKKKQGIDPRREDAQELADLLLNLPI